MNKILLVMLLLIGTAEAKRFASQYCEFELPPGWQCSIEGSEWVCQSENKSRKKESIIILAAKIRGSGDSLAQYQGYLKQRKTFNLPGGKTQVSEGKYAKMTTINKHRWVDALHLASEVPGFYTRYLATVKEDLGVAVTFSVAKDHYASYQPLFDKVVNSLRVFRQKASNAHGSTIKPKDENLLDGSTFIPGQDRTHDLGVGDQKSRKGSGTMTTSDIVMYVVIAIILLFGYMRMKKKKKKKKK